MKMSSIKTMLPGIAILLWAITGALDMFAALVGLIGLIFVVSGMFHKDEEG